MKNFIKEILYIKKGSFNQSEYLKIDIQDNKNIVKYLINDKSKIFEVDDYKINIFTERLNRTIDSWQEKYIDNSVIDGSIWQLSILYKNGFQKNYSGKNIFPGNFNNFNQLKKQLLE